MSSAQILLLILASAIETVGKRRRQMLRERFGPEYHRVIKKEGGVRKGEQVLEFRQKHREMYKISPLSLPDRSSFSYRGNEVQAQFADDPKGAVTLAAFVDEPRKAMEQGDNLVASAMKRLAEVLADERSKLEKPERTAQWRLHRGPPHSPVSISGFFQRLLSVWPAECISRSRCCQAAPIMTISALKCSSVSFQTPTDCCAPKRSRLCDRRTR